MSFEEIAKQCCSKGIKIGCYKSNGAYPEVHAEVVFSKDVLTEMGWLMGTPIKVEVDVEKKQLRFSRGQNGGHKMRPHGASPRNGLLRFSRHKIPFISDPHPMKRMPSEITPEGLVVSYEQNLST
jgi:hypothetical protein